MKDMEPARIQAYDEWLAEHLEELMSQYPGKVVATHQEGILIVGDSEIEVYREIREKGFDPMPLVFRVPREEDFQSLL